MISKNTIRAYRLTNAAVEVLEAAGCTDATVDEDYVALADNGAGLFDNCTEGAEEDSVAGWRDYVDCLVAAKPGANHTVGERMAINAAVEFIRDPTNEKKHMAAIIAMQNHRDSAMRA